MLARRRLACGLTVLVQGCLIELNPEFVVEGDEVAEGAPVESSDTGESDETDESDTSSMDGSDTSSDMTDTDTDTSGDVPCPDDCLFDGINHPCVDGTCEAGLFNVIFEDTYAGEQNPSQTHGFEDRLRVSSGQGMAQRAFLELPLLDTLPPGLESMTVTLVVYSDTGTTMIDMHRIVEPWSASTLTWMSMPMTQPLGGPMPLQSGFNEIDLSDYLEAVVGSPSYGIVLRTMSASDIQLRSSEDLGGMSPQVHYELRW